MNEDLGRYLRPGPQRRRVITLMADGHGRSKHGTELGAPDRTSYAARVLAHLRKAPIAVAVTDPQGQNRPLLADAATNQVAWITPHKEHRSTLFSPRRGVEHYLNTQRVQSPPGRWRPVDADALRGRPTARAVARLRSADRRPPPPGHER